MNNKKQKPIIICGVMNMDGTPAKRTKEETERFITMMSNNGEYDVIYREDTIIPDTMSIIAKINKTNNE